MGAIIKKTVRVLRHIVGAILIAIGAYTLAALVLGVLPRNAEFHDKDNGVTVYVRSNGVHTDIVLPHLDIWQHLFPAPVWAAHAPFIAFGWGDKRFFMETPHWRDLKPEVALSAMFGLGDSVMRVEYAGSPQAEAGDVVLHLSQGDYSRLVARILTSFKLGNDGSPLHIPFSEGVGQPVFYEAVGRYSLISTCNDWTRSVLTDTGIRTAVWSPFPAAIFHHLERIPRANH